MWCGDDIMWAVLLGAGKDEVNDSDWIHIYCTTWHVQYHVSISVTSEICSTYCKWVMFCMGKVLCFLCILLLSQTLFWKMVLLKYFKCVDSRPRNFSSSTKIHKRYAKPYPLTEYSPFAVAVLYKFAKDINFGNVCFLCFYNFIFALNCRNSQNLFSWKICTCL